MSLARVIIRTMLFVVALMGYFAVSLTILLFTGFNFDRARPYLIKLISITSKVGLKIFGVSIQRNFAPIPNEKNFLMVSNHLSYLDVLIISSVFPTCFVTSTEMKETPFLGQMCLLGGCLFVERRRKAGITGEVQEISSALRSGLNVVIFPEATSTNGEAVIRFRRPLFQAAINSNTKILPLCLNYRTLDGEKLTLKNRDKVFWYGDMEFLGHALALFAHKSVVADLSVMPSLSAQDFEDKNALCDRAYEVVSYEYQVITHAD